MTGDGHVRGGDASEGLTDALLEAMPGGVVHVAVDGAVLAANRHALDVLGLSFDEITKRYTQDWEPETILEDGSACSAADYPVTQTLLTGEARGPTTVGVRRPSGDVVWCVFTAHPIRNTAHELTGVVVTFIDITARKRIEDAQRESEAVLQSILDNIPSIVIKSDLDGRLLFINRLSEELPPEFTKESLIGTSVFDFIDEDDRDRVRSIFDQVVATGEPITYETSGRASLDPNWYSTRVGPLWRDGKVVELLMVATNVTAYNLATRENVELQAQLNTAQRLESLGRLAGGIAHDFNNLLTVIQGHVDVLTAKATKHDTRASVSAIGDATARAASMTRQLLAFSRHQGLDPHHVRVNDVVRGVLGMLSRLLGDDVDLVFEPAMIASYVFVDPIQLERVIVNLATNARDATPRGGTVRIRTRLGPDGFVLIDVIDSGPGIDMKTQHRMFEPFFTTKSRGDGTGLGLATVHGIVAQSGGDVEVASADNGTQVTVKLPLSDDPVGASDPSPDETPSRQGVERVLLVEDAPAVRRITAQILEDAGYRVDSAASAREVIEGDDFSLEDYDLLLTDVVMPQVNGPELAAHVMTVAEQIKVLFMSGYMDANIRDSGIPMSRVSFIAKPFTADGLLDAVREILERESPS